MPRPAKKRSTQDELDDALERIEELEARIDELEAWDGQEDGGNDSFVRDQLDTLAVDVDTSSAPQTAEQWRRCLREILRGVDWRGLTWR